MGMAAPGRTKFYKPEKQIYINLHSVTFIMMKHIPLPVIMNRKIKKPPVKLNFCQPQ